MKLKGSRRRGRGWNAEKESGGGGGWAWNSRSPFVFIINMSMEGRYLWEKRPSTWSSEEVWADWARPPHNNIKGLCPFNTLRRALWIRMRRAFKSRFIAYRCAWCGEWEHPPEKSLDPFCPRLLMEPGLLPLTGLLGPNKAEQWPPVDSTW